MMTSRCCCLLSGDSCTIGRVPDRKAFMQDAFSLAEPGGTYIGERLEDLRAPDGFAFVADVVPLAALIPAETDGDYRVRLREHLVARARAEKPRTRTLLVSLPEAMGAAPPPGSFVVTGARGIPATWRVWKVDQLAVDGVDPERDNAPCQIPTRGFLFELEPVDPHDVPVTARVYELPWATSEVGEWSPEPIRPHGVVCAARMPCEDEAVLAYCEKPSGHVEAGDWMHEAMVGDPAERFTWTATEAIERA